MTTIDSLILCVEESSLKNLTVWDYLVRMCTLLGSPLLSEVLVELQEHMQAVQDRNPLLLATQSDTADVASLRVPVMEALVTEWRINRRVRKLISILQREIIRRQSEEKPVPGCSKTWISQDFPSLCSKTQAKTVPIYILCDHILNKYDLFMDKRFRELHRDVQLELSSSQNKELQHDVTSCTTDRNINNGSTTESNSLPIEEKWFSQYQRPSSPKADTKVGARRDKDQKIKKHKKSGRKPTMGKQSKPEVQATASVKTHSWTCLKYTPTCSSGRTLKKDTRKRPNKQETKGHKDIKADVASSATTEAARKQMAKKKCMQYEAQMALYDKIFMAATLPESVLKSVDAQSKIEAAVKERNRQAVLAHIARFQIRKINRSSEVETKVVKGDSGNRKASDSSLNGHDKTKCAKTSAGSSLKTKTGKSLKRKASDIPILGTSQHSKYVKLDTGSAVKAFYGHVIKRQH